MAWDNGTSSEQLDALFQGTDDLGDGDEFDAELLEIQKSMMALEEPQASSDSQSGPPSHASLPPSNIPSPRRHPSSSALLSPAHNAPYGQPASSSGDSNSGNASTSYNSPQTRPDTPLTLKRPRAETQTNLSPSGIGRNKSRRQDGIHTDMSNAARNNSDSTTVRLHEILGLSDSDDLFDIEQQHRETEDYLKKREEQLRKDEEFARSLQAAWTQQVPSSPSHSSSIHDASDFNTTALMPPPTGPIAAGRTSMPIGRHSNYLPSSSRAAAFSSSSSWSQSSGAIPDRRPAPYSRSYIDLTGDSDQELAPHEPSKTQRGIPERPASVNSFGNTPSARPGLWNPIFPGPRNLGPNRQSTVGPPQPGTYGIMGSEHADLFDDFPELMRSPWASSYASSSSTSNPPPRTDHFRRSQPVNGYRSLGDPYTSYDPNDLLHLMHGPFPGSSQSGYPYYAPPGSELGSALSKVRDTFQQGHITSGEVKKELENLLQNIRPDQELNINREGTPDALKYPLMEHQKLGLAWMKSMEEGSNKGGILADDMGLGKTIQALALMITRQSDDTERKTSLIIAPVALLQQWKREIEQKLKPGGHQLSVFILHGEKRHARFSQLKKYDVVLTTYGTLASEMKYKQRYDQMKIDNPELYERNNVGSWLSVLGDHCKWYRIILDEAQCIKNRNTKTAQACCGIRSTYRWCMSGTPMMNNVEELYSLIKFLRIGPYNKLETFTSTFSRPLKNAGGQSYDRAMQKLQALLKAVLLRRTKTSKIDGKSILQLPPRTTEKVYAVFSDDETEFYRALETRSQLQFNKYLQAGTIGKNYSNVLVLLLRLRQACCHPHLIQDFGTETNNPGEGIDLVANAKLLDSVVVARLKEKENLECPVCIDAIENGIIFYPCGHSTCPECFARISDPSTALAQGNDSGPAEVKCPNCRGKVDPKKVTDTVSFRKAFITGETEDAGDNNEGKAEDTDSDDSDTDSLDKFIVKDDEHADADDEGEGEGDTAASRRKSKGKAPAKPKKTLAALKKESSRNAKAKRKYLRYLEKRWEPSAKSDKAMEILEKIQTESNDEKTIVFSQFTSMLDLLEVPIRRAGWGYRRYDGGMKPAERNEAVLEFSDSPDCRIMLVSLKAGNSGLNLNAASQVIIFDPFWNPYIEEQAIDRAHRIGQLRPVVVHRVLVDKTVEDRILSLQDKKRELIEGALDEKASGQISRLNTRELAYLFNVPAQ